MINVIGRTHLCNDSEVTARPSTADRTLIAGVIAPSPTLKNDVKQKKENRYEGITNEK